MKIAFSGSHGTGKTTHVLKKAHELKLQYPNKSIDILSEVARKSYLPINQNSTKESQL
jgi:cytidylate kinase